MPFICAWGTKCRFIGAVPLVTLEFTQHVRECPPEGKPAARFVPEDGARWLESRLTLRNGSLRSRR